MREDNIRQLRDTLQCIRQGARPVNGRWVPLQLDPEQRLKVIFYPEEQVEDVCDAMESAVPEAEPCRFTCQNMDAFALARQREQERPTGHAPFERPVLVLNLANPVYPGGGVRRGARAQEECLCLASTLLPALESPEAAPYYLYNRDLHSSWGSDSALLVPQVEVFRDEYGRYLEQSAVVSVLTCAAPVAYTCHEVLSESEYRLGLYQRIRRILLLAAHWGYTRLVLGAFGCGAFGNDAALVSDLFYQAFVSCLPDHTPLHRLFRQVDFAVLDRSSSGYNYKHFCRNFAQFKFPEPEPAEPAAKAEPAVPVQGARDRRDQVRGCLFGGAVGDALGYPVEFMSRNQILQMFGPGGVSGYALYRNCRAALISDDTQMSLFTAAGLLVNQTRYAQDGTVEWPRHTVAQAYQDWLNTQNAAPGGPFDQRHKGISWLSDVRELFSPRAPGNTCLSALRARRDEPMPEDYIASPLNNSKGCGGIMRVAPLALVGLAYTQEQLDWEGAQLAAITHGHPLGYMPAAVLTHLLSSILALRPDAPRPSLRELVLDAQSAVSHLFQTSPALPQMNELIDRALELSGNSRPDAENLLMLGEGWVAEETLAIALYCSLRHSDDFSAGVCAAVNHSGDSDSTGAVTGNILGAWLGYEAIDSKWKDTLELSGVILEMADDLTDGCPMLRGADACGSKWLGKYARGSQEPARPNTVLFWHEDEENGYLSNWYACPFVVDDFKYLHVEQYLMARKAKAFHDAEHYTAILRADTPAECKRLGRLVTPFDGQQWGKQRYQVLVDALDAKFRQNDELREQLLGTGDAILAEASPLDTIWGIGLNAADAERTAPERWPGQNLAGKALMEVRQRLREEQQ